MTKVSRIPVEKERMNRFYDDFWSAVALLETKREARGFLFDLLTHTERKMFSKRLQIAMMLLEGYGYQDIRSYVKVSDATIAKVNNWLNTGATGLIKIAERLISLKKKKLEEVRTGGKKYLSGDLLMPGVEAGLDLAAAQLKKRRKRKSV